MQRQCDQSNDGDKLALEKILQKLMQDLGILIKTENMEESFSHLGLDSIMMMELIVGLEESLNIQLPLDQLSRENLANPRAILAFVESSLVKKISPSP